MNPFSPRCGDAWLLSLRYLKSNSGFFTPLHRIFPWPLLSINVRHVLLDWKEITAGSFEGNKRHRKASKVLTYACSHAIHPSMKNHKTAK